ncbi:Transcription elongation factor Spt4 [Candidatus Gugararchaeum adminiculabundum]|nr:Transcription elongation factor Spt4 [Candidatus Gugararchaeum adminiculabundum]
MAEKACKTCHLIIKEGVKCPSCQGENLSEKYSGYIVVFDPEKSELAKKIGAKIPGKYAVKIK